MSELVDATVERLVLSISDGSHSALSKVGSQDVASCIVKGHDSSLAVVVSVDRIAIGSQRFRKALAVVVATGRWIKSKRNFYILR